MINVGCYAITSNEPNLNVGKLFLTLHTIFFGNKCFTMALMCMCSVLNVVKHNAAWLSIASINQLIAVKYLYRGTGAFKKKIAKQLFKKNTSML